MSIRLFVLFSILVFQVSMFAQPVWHLKAEIAKESYIAGEPIDVGISVTNLSFRTIRANLPSAYGDSPMKKVRGFPLG